MLLGVIIRPALMTFGLVLGLIGFNAIMQIANLLFAPTVENLDPASDNSYISAGVYMIFYGTLAYTLANSSFKAIDLLPNFVMGWIGQRMESRADDAIMVQQQASGYMQTMAYSSRGEMDTSSSYGQFQAEKKWLQAGGIKSGTPEPAPQFRPEARASLNNANAPPPVGGSAQQVPSPPSTTGGGKQQAGSPSGRGTGSAGKKGGLT
jgi:hypothetical protein